MPLTGLPGARAEWRRRPVEQRLRLTVLAVVAPALAVLLGALDAVQHAPLPPLQRPLVIAVLLLLSEYPLVNVRFGANHISVVWTEAVVVLGLATLPLPWVLVVIGPGVVLSHVLQRRALLKAGFNGASATVSVLVAGLLVHALGGGPGITSVASVLVLVAASMTYNVVNVLLVNLVVSVAQDAPYRQIVRGSTGLTTLAWGGNVSTALVALTLVEQSPALLLGLPAVAGALALTYRAYLRASQERDVWRQLEVASRELNSLQEHEVAEAALRRARGLFRCDDVELRLDAYGDVPARSCRLVDDRLVVVPVPPVPGPGRAGWVDLDAEGDEPVVRTSLSSPLACPEGRIGALRLLFAGAVTLSPRERQVLSTYAHAVSTTLQNARLHEDVRADAARHAHDATHDALTGLANRLLLQQRAAAALAADGTTALLLLDLDHFKEINDTLGHSAGDLLLQEVAARLRGAVPDAEGCLVARLGGDEFAVLLPGLAAPEDAEPLAARLLQHLAVPVEFEGLRLSVEASIGLACHPQDAATPDELFRRADVAMYQAKATRGSWLRYDADRDDSSVHRLALVSELRLALERDEILVHVQPQVDLVTGQVVSAEALCRWQHPVRGLLAPTDFIGVVEQSGLVRLFTLRVLELALTGCAAWRADGHQVRVAVNLAARSLLDRALPDDVAAVLARTGVRPQDLVLEITETTATSELEVVEDVLARLRRTGVEISVDDFGTGYSSLAFLQRTAVNELKVDRSFVSGMLVNDNDAALVRATVQLAHSLGARAVAEGVEDADHARALRELGCDVAQGWLYGRPVPPEELQERLGRTAVVLPAQGGRLLRLQA
ncbi:MAG: diguanylate cyclase/phosphodiesterase [Frankiales bacterium]|nr:diguanylate cyclase/phosphodiesterase [Frankiales bacterium]